MDANESTQSLQNVLNQISGASPAVLVRALVTLVIGIALTRLLASLLGKALKKADRLPPILISLTLTGIRIVCYVVTMLSAASTLGIATDSFVALLSVLTLAFSLAVQGILGNVVGGIILMINKPFQIGDFIDYDTVTGTVLNIELLQTKMLSPDGRTVYVPNSVMYTSRLTNYNVHGQRRVEITVSASYDDDPQKVLRLLEQLAAEHALVLSDPPCRAFLDSYEDSAIRYGLWVWTQSANFLQVKQDLLLRMYSAFAQQGIRMTYPHVNVHVHSEKTKQTV